TPASAQALDVTLTASPSSIQAGQSAQVQVLVTVYGAPVSGAAVTIAVVPAIATITPSYGYTDGNGRFFTTLTAGTTAAGSLTLAANASYSTTGEFPETLTGNGRLVVPITPPVITTTVTPTYHVNIIPVAQFRVAFPDNSRTVTLDAGNSYDPDGTIVSYLWDLGDGSSAMGSVVTHSYVTGGQYTVTLTAIDNAGGRSSSSLRVGVNSPQPPVSQLLASPTSGTVPLTVSFNGQQSYDPDGSIALYAWNFGDGTGSQGLQTSHTYRAQGTYSVTLTVTDNQGLTAMSSPLVITASARGIQTPTTGTFTPATPPPVVTPTPVPVVRSSCGGLSSAGFRNPCTPLSGILPLPVLFLLSVLAGTGIAAMAAIPSTKGISQRLEKGEQSVKGYLTSTASSFLSRFEVSRRKLGPVGRSGAIIFGLTTKELLVILLCAGAYALAFLLKDRLLINPATLLILAVAGVITTLTHQMGHHEAARRAGQVAELQFWGLGTVLLVVSSWIFGYLFASPSRNLFQKVPDQSPRTTAMINLAGPAVSVAVAMASLLLIPLGSTAAFFGRTLFSLNLMNGIYSLVPFDPMDGKPVFDWNPTAWAAVFFPLLTLYAAVYLL
ncbi:MAG: PKD domain-containing protein, partial [Methanomicrobiales archaeon]|nr:PKD domain-containing protein [Methanomicrobiales archaeon]